MRFTFSIFVLLFCFQFSPLTLVSCDTVIDALYDLINLAEEAKASSETSISNQYNQVVHETDDELYTKAIPRINKIYNGVDEHVETLMSQASSFNVDFTSCLKYVEEATANSASLSKVNVTAKAIDEKKSIYNKIFYDTLMTGLNNLNAIRREISIISDEYLVCEQSLLPQYCNGTLYHKVVQRQENTPFEYKKESQITNLNLIQQEMVYRSRIQDYMDEAIKSATPYIAFLETCLKRLISVN